MCHTSRLNFDRTNQFNAMPVRWQRKFEDATDYIRPRTGLYGEARLAEYDAQIADAFDQVLAEMGKSGERVVEAVAV